MATLTINLAEARVMLNALHGLAPRDHGELLDRTGLQVKVSKAITKDSDPKLIKRRRDALTTLLDLEG